MQGLKKKINTDIYIKGSKNSSLPIICASLLARGKVTLKNVPRILDVFNLIKILKYLDVKVKFKGNTLKVDSTNITNKVLDLDIIKTFRASYYLIPVMLILFDECIIFLPGGCKIGKRGIDAHIDLFTNLGYECLIDKDILDIHLKERYGSINYALSKKSVGASMNAIMLALNFEEAIISNLVIEPEGKDLCNFIRKLGYNINYTSTEFICHGQNSINTNIKHKIIPDRMETMSYLCFGLLYGKVRVINTNADDLAYVIKLLKEANFKLKVNKRSITSYKSSGNCFNISTGNYPLFPTDLQPILGVLNIFSKGMGKIEENIFSSRMSIYEKLNKFGGNTNVIDNKAYIVGGCDIEYIDSVANDLREGMGLILAGSKNGAKIDNIDVVLRGYDSLFYNLYLLGLKFKIK